MTRLFRSYLPLRSVTPVFQTQKRHTTTLNRHAGFRTWHPSRSQFAGAPCTFTRLLPIDSKDGQRWLTNPSTNRRFGDGPHEKRALHGLRHGKNALPHPLCCPFFRPLSRNREQRNRDIFSRLEADWGQNATIRQTLKQAGRKCCGPADRAAVQDRFLHHTDKHPQKNHRDGAASARDIPLDLPVTGTSSVRIGSSRRRRSQSRSRRKRC